MRQHSRNHYSRVHPLILDGNPRLSSAIALTTFAISPPYFINGLYEVLECFGMQNAKIILTPLPQGYPF